MNYVLSIAADAVVDLRDLDIWLQEDVLDELEHLVSACKPRPDRLSEFVHDLERIAEHSRQWY